MCLSAQETPGFVQPECLYRIHRITLDLRSEESGTAKSIKAIMFSWCDMGNTPNWRNITFH